MVQTRRQNKRIYPLEKARVLRTIATYIGKIEKTIGHEQKMKVCEQLFPYIWNNRYAFDLKGSYGDSKFLKETILKLEEFSWQYPRN